MRAVRQVLRAEEQPKEAHEERTRQDGAAPVRHVRQGFPGAKQAGQPREGGAPEGEVVHLQHVRPQVLLQQRPEHPHAHPHEREAVQVRLLRQELPAFVASHLAHDYQSHAQVPARVHHLPEGLHETVGAETSR